MSVVVLVALSVPSLGRAAAPPMEFAGGAQIHVLDPSLDYPLPEADGHADYQTVFSPDERVRISPTTSLPASAIAFIINFDQWGNPLGSCTGTLIGQQTVLTAGHCLYNPEWGGWADQTTVVPGKDGVIDPFGHSNADIVAVPNGWFYNQDPSYDFGLIKLPTNMGSRVGWFRVGVLSTSSLTDAHFQPTAGGYPGDKPLGTQWGARKESFLYVDDRTLYTDLDLFAGQSGSAVWRATDGLVVGVVSRESSTANAANRISRGTLDWMMGACADMSCTFDYYEESIPAPPPPAAPTPPPAAPTPPPGTPIPPPVPSIIGSTAFLDVWNRTDNPVASGRTSRTWMWGPQGYTPMFTEPYSEAPGGQRTVQYFDKSRMEITNPGGDPSSLWYVTNGLLSSELIHGAVQLGDTASEVRAPAQINVAGDPDDSFGPTYASFTPLLGAAPLPISTAVTQIIGRSGQVGDRPEFAQYGVTATILVPETNHTVASPFWDFMNSQGLVQQAGQTIYDRLFVNPFYATGYPIIEPYWAQVKVGGVVKDVLVQCFERRCLTYTPSNPAGWQVEAGNVGQHYYRWRYGQ